MGVRRGRWLRWRAGVWSRRVTWRGFLVRQRVLAVWAILTLLGAVPMIFGAVGPRVEILVVDTFVVHPVPLAWFLGSLGVAALCVGAASTPLPRRRMTALALLVVVIVFTLVWFATMIDLGSVRRTLLVALAVAGAGALIGLVARRLGWAMLGVALVCWLAAALVWYVVALVAISGGQPGRGGRVWYLALAAHQLTFVLAYLTFLVVTIAAPLGLLTGTAAHYQSARRLVDVQHRPRLLTAVCLVGGAGLGVWAGLQHRDEVSPVPWVVSAGGALVVLAVVTWTAYRPMVEQDGPIAGYVLAAVLALPYLLLIGSFVGGNPDVLVAIGSWLIDWRWVLLATVSAVFWLRRRRLTTGLALLVLVTVVELARRFGHVRPDTNRWVAVLLVLVGLWELARLLGWRRQVGGRFRPRHRVALVRLAVLAALVVGVLGLITDEPRIQSLLFAGGVVVGSAAVLVLGQPGRDLPIPHRGAAYLRAAGWAVVVIGAQAVMLATPDGLELARTAQSQSAALLVLPLVAVYAGFRGAPRLPEPVVVPAS